MTQKFFTLTARSELAGLIEAAGLGHVIDEDTLVALADIRAQLQDRIGELSERLMERQISRAEFIEELDRAMAAATRAGEKLMDPEGFRKVFGELKASNFGDVAAFAPC